jgi:chemotaxis protein MotB
MSIETVAWIRFRGVLLLLPGVLAVPLVGCNAVPMNQFRQSQFQTLSLYRQNRTLSEQLASMNQTMGQLAMEKQNLELATAQLQGDLQVANDRLANLGAERQELHQRYTNLLTGLNDQKNPLNSEATRRFEELARKYPEFEFDPYTGVSKFTGDLLFSSGSAEIRNDASPVLTEFARIMSEPDARQFNILVVGHTDDQPIAKPATRARHGSNWELSAHRATAVVSALSRFGLAEQRMGVAGYSQFQPVATNTNEPSRQQNRRVEIYILAPDAAVAGGWDVGPHF